MSSRTTAPSPPASIDPAAWGGDHVGRPIPEYVTGDECLFCHRNDIGSRWQSNRHHLTIRELDPGAAAIKALAARPGLREAAGEVELVLGGERRLRFLKRAGFGRLALHSASWNPGREGSEQGILEADNAAWSDAKFADACAGCHATAVETEHRSFSAVTLDCYVCHGAATLEHTLDSSRMILARARKDPPGVVISICAQCHARGGKSRSTGLPYPNNFVAGDNVFRDFEVDFSPAALQGLAPVDRHVLENIRDVVLYGKEEITCLDCHDVHAGSSRKHRALDSRELCGICHTDEGPVAMPPRAVAHNKTCEY